VTDAETIEALRQDAQELRNDLERQRTLILDARKAQAVLLEDIERLRAENEALRAAAESRTLDARIRELRGGA